jgi:hypothetical protein
VEPSINLLSQPPEFRAKYEQLKQLIDPINNKPIADILGDPRRGFTVNPSGGHTFYFWGGAIYSFDHTGRFPLVCVHGPIYELHLKLGGVDGGFGRPITDVVDLTDGTKCCIMEGGHIHSWGNKADPCVFPRKCPAKYLTFFCNEKIPCRSVYSAVQACSTDESFRNTTRRNGT